MRIAIPDDYQQVIEKLHCFSLLNKHDVTIIHDYILNEKELASKLNNPEVIVLTRTRTKITPSLLEMLPNLKIISQTGKNTGHIDIDACTKAGVIVLEGRGSPIAPAELTWALIMNGMRKIPQAIGHMKSGKWQKNIGRRVYGSKIGIWGYGKIGKRIAQYAKAFEAEVIVWGSKNSRKNAISDGFKAANSKKDFFSSCDVVSLHLRLKTQTKDIVTFSDLSSMKSDALLVNTARSSLIEKGALLKALKKGVPGFAAIDVYDEEPIFNVSHPLLKMENVICTPHVGYVEKNGYELYFSIAFTNILDYLNGKTNHVSNPKAIR